jgi:ribosomal protein S18 acetylase RimI-like enzyme
MKSDDYHLVERTPTVEQYLRLRASVGWRHLDESMAATALANSLYVVCVLHDNKVIGCGRIVGDGGVFFYVQDVAILPDFQGKGLGKRLMTALMHYIASHAHPGATIGLMAAPGAAGFYTQFGFEVCPPDRPGMSQIWGEQ